LQTNPSGSSHPRSFVPEARTRAEARVARKDAPEGLADPWEALYGRFSLLDVTSGPPDDSREAGERQAERHLRDLRGRVRAARAVVSATPGLAEILQRDPPKATPFYVRYGITPEQFYQGARVMRGFPRVPTG
jgi:hypothetical protein